MIWAYDWIGTALNHNLRLPVRRVRSVERTALRQLGYNVRMPNYRRSYNGSTYFFTVVTYHRQPILTAEVARNVLHAAWVEVQNRHPFSTDAICLLPEHIHCIWTLPEGDTNYSMRWKEIKRLFTNELVQCVREWPWSSFHRYVEQGYYSQAWGAEEERLAQLSIGE